MLLFKDLKANYPVFLLDRQNMAYQQGVVKEVSFPHIETGKPNFNGMQQQMVVDLTVTTDGHSATYVIPDSLSVAYVGSNSIVLATDKESVCREIEAQKAVSEEAIAALPHHKDVVEKATKLLSELSSSYRDKAQYEERFSKIENNMGEMKDMLSSLIQELKR